MSFNKKTVRDVTVKDKRVLVRVDYNVPLDEKGRITDDYRIKKSLPTIEYLLKQNAKVILCSHLGRPGGKPDNKYSLKPCAKRLEKLLGKPVDFVDDCVGPAVKTKVDALQSGGILMLENVRFHAEEEANDPTFAKELASYAQVFVQDAFGVVHHPAVSVSELPKYLPGVAGFLLEKEVNTITDVMEKPARPLVAVIGGAKISDKIDMLKRFIDIADFVAVGGAMANTFLLAEGIKVGKSLAEREEVPLAREIIQHARAKAKTHRFIFYLPQDAVVATDIYHPLFTRIVDWDAHVVAAIQDYPKRPPRSSERVLSSEMILDIGPFSGAFIAGGIQLANTVIWNGALGVTETPGYGSPVGPFAHGTELLVDAMLGEFGHKPFTVVGGGDTVGYVEARKLTDYFNHVSTGGGASLELMSGKRLPGVEALQDKK
ncbi:MAG TPA: phosphoglycerate kinase [Patescibacteria group bacterium]|nr:phosphoglycerate kinase [Patescibacteria group bacterium]